MGQKYLSSTAQWEYNFYDTDQDPVVSSETKKNLRMKYSMILGFLLLSLLATSSDGYNIFLTHELGTKSHLLQLFPIIEKLLEQGHSVHAAIFSPSKIKHQNYTEILVKNVFEDKNEIVSKMYMEKGGQGMFNVKLYQMAWEVWHEMVGEIATVTYNTPGISV